MATRKKIALRLIVIVAIVFAALLFGAPVFLNIDRYRPRIISYFEESTGKKVEIERLALTLVPQPTIHISGFGVSRSALGGVVRLHLPGEPQNRQVPRAKINSALTRSLQVGGPVEPGSCTIRARCHVAVTSRCEPEKPNEGAPHHVDITESSG